MDSLTKQLELPASINTNTSIPLITATVVALLKQLGAGWITQRFEVYKQALVSVLSLPLDLQTFAKCPFMSHL